jgi:hypothetical protein
MTLGMWRYRWCDKQKEQLEAGFIEARKELIIAPLSRVIGFQPLVVGVSHVLVSCFRVQTSPRTKANEL